MFKRIVLAAALFVAPLVLTPMSVDAQERGQETAEASAESGLATSAANGRPTTLPPGMENLPDGQELPPGITLTREVPEPEADDNDGCTVTINPLTGEPEFNCPETQ